MYNPQILIGADPEVFMKNPNSDVFVSAHGHIPGDKEKPHPVQFGAVQVDGMALEFNITPAATMAEFLRNTKEVYSQLRGMVPGYNVVADPVAFFDNDYFDQQPEESKALGCSPDYNAWTELVNDAPATDVFGGRHMRVAAGHIHIGWTEGKRPDDQTHFSDCCALVRQLDYYLGLPSLLWDPDTQRRQMYGKAGAFRPKPYGCEYRVLSNAWLKSDYLMRWVYTAARKGTLDLFNGIDLVDKYGDIARHHINTHNSSWSTDTSIEIPIELPRVA